MPMKVSQHLRFSYAQDKNSICMGSVVNKTILDEDSQN